MPRVYKKKPGAKTYRKYDQNELEKAVAAIKMGMSIRKASKKFKITRSVLWRHKTNPNISPQGGQTALNANVEKHLVQRIITCAEWGYPLDSVDLRMLVKGYLDRRGVVIKRFKKNMPGKEWAISFLKRHKKAGFEKCGIVPLNRQKVLDRLPEGKNEQDTETEVGDREGLDDSFRQLLQEMRYAPENETRKRKKKVEVKPGQSITGKDVTQEKGEPSVEASRKENNRGKESEITEAESFNSDSDESGDEGTAGNSSGSDIEESDSYSVDSTEVRDNSEGVQSRQDESKESEESDDHTEDSPSMAKKRKTNHLQLQEDDFVIFEYEEELFPGVVTKVLSTGCLIKSMEKSGVNWRWPKVPDEMFYVNKDIKQKIQPPKMLKRGVLQIEELRERW